MDRFQENDRKGNADGRKKYFIPLLILSAVLTVYAAVSIFVIYNLYAKVNSLRRSGSEAEAALETANAEIGAMRQELNKKIMLQKEPDGTTGIRCLNAVKGGEKYTIYQLPMTDEAGGCCYAIEMPDGGLVMIDSGYESDAQYIYDFIVGHGGKVDSWFITHPHFDHAGGLVRILNSSLTDIKIDKIYYAPFTEAFFKEEEEGKDMAVINNALLFYEFEGLRKAQEGLAAENRIEFIPVERGRELKIGEIGITCMHSFDEKLYDVNGNSLVLRLDIGDISMMITGDITDASIDSMINTLGEDNPLWNVDFVQIPHHGYLAGISSDRLYRLTSPYAAFVDCSAKEYNTNAVNITEHLKWLEELKIPVVKRFEGINKLVIE